jgi:hypothetical protein
MISGARWPWKLIGGAVGVLVASVALTTALSTVSNWRAAAARLPAIEAERDAARDYIVQYRKAAKAEHLRVNKASKGYQDELKALRITALAQPARVVRLCRPAGGSAGSAGTASQSGPDGAATGAGELSEATGSGVEQGPDIGPELYAIADDADRIVAQCRALQEYVNGLPLEP